jgi:hypothetical protein
MIRITRCRSTRQNEDRNAGHGNEADRATNSTLEITLERLNEAQVLCLSERPQVATS